MRRFTAATSVSLFLVLAVERTAPSSTAKISIMARAVRFAPKVPTEGAADDGIGGKVFVAGYSRDSHHCSESVSQDLTKGTWVLMRPNTRYRPSRSRVFRRK